MISTIENEWGIFSRTPSELQLRQLRMAFYAGFGCAFKELVQISGTLSEDEACKKLDGLEAELKAYVAALPRVPFS